MKHCACNSVLPSQCHIEMICILVHMFLGGKSLEVRDIHGDWRRVVSEKFAKKNSLQTVSCLFWRSTNFPFQQQHRPFSLLTFVTNPSLDEGLGWTKGASVGVMDGWQGSGSSVLVTCSQCRKAAFRHFSPKGTEKLLAVFLFVSYGLRAKVSQVSSAE